MRLLLTLFVLLLLCPNANASVKMDKGADRFEIVEPIIVAEDDILVRLSELKRSLATQKRKVLELLERLREQNERIKEDLETYRERLKQSPKAFPNHE